MDSKTPYGRGFQLRCLQEHPEGVLLGFSPPNLEPGLTEEKIGTGLDGGAKTCEKNMKIKSIRR